MDPTSSLMSVAAGGTTTAHISQSEAVAAAASGYPAHHPYHNPGDYNDDSNYTGYNHHMHHAAYNASAMGGFSNSNAADPSMATTMALVAYLRSEADLAELKAKRLIAQANTLAQTFGVTMDMQSQYELDPAQLPPLDEHGVPKYKGKKRGRKPKVRKRQRNPYRKKRQHTAYTLFVKEKYPGVKSLHPGLASKQVISLVAKQWGNEISPEEKREWKQRALETHCGEEEEEEVPDGVDADADGIEEEMDVVGAVAAATGGTSGGVVGVGMVSAAVGDATAEDEDEEEEEAEDDDEDDDEEEEDDEEEDNDIGSASATAGVEASFVADEEEEDGEVEDDEDDEEEDDIDDDDLLGQSRKAQQRLKNKKYK